MCRCRSLCYVAAQSKQCSWILGPYKYIPSANPSHHLFCNFTFPSRNSLTTQLCSLPLDLQFPTVPNDIFCICTPTILKLAFHLLWTNSFQHHEHRHSSSSRISRPTVLPICPIVLRVRHPSKPLPLPDFGPNSGLRRLRRGRMCGMARGCVRVLLPTLEGSPHHGPSSLGGLPPRCILLAHLDSQGPGSLLISWKNFWWAVLVVSSLYNFEELSTAQILISLPFLRMSLQPSEHSTALHCAVCT